MAYKVAQGVNGQAAGATYSGPAALLPFYLAHGYVYDDSSVTLTGSTDAVNIVTGGALVIKVNGSNVSTTLATADTPAQAATKIDTALGVNGDAAIVANKLQVKAIGSARGAGTLEVVSGAGTTLANLGLAVAQKGVAADLADNTDTVPANDPTLAVNREDPGDAFQFGTDTALPPRLEAVDTVNEALNPAALPAAGGTPLYVFGDNFTGATGVTFGGTSGTAFSVIDDDTIAVTSPAKAAGAYAVVVTKGVGNSNSLANGVTYV